jgi:predicted metalloendopeptidase
MNSALLAYPLAVVPVALAIAACGSAPPPAPAPPQAASSMASAAPAPAAPTPVVVTLESVGLDPKALDRTTDPCTDFYRFSCGSWIDSTKIPEDRPSYSRSFSSIADRNEADIRQIVEDAAAGKIATPAGKKVGAYYAACMDVDAIEKTGLAPIEPLRKLIRAVHDDATLGAAVAELHKAGVNVFFSYAEDQDYKNAQSTIGEIDQAGLGLPEKGFYVRDDDKSKDLRKAYQAYVEKMARLAGASAGDAKSTAADVLRIETALANISKSNVERRDPKSLYHRIDRDGVLAAGKTFPWAAYLDARGQGSQKEINVTNPDYLGGLDKILASEKPAALRHYLDWHALTSIGLAAPRQMDQERFAFNKLLSGQDRMRERWKRCIASTQAALGELVARPYLDRRFDGESKAAAEHMISGIRQAFGDDLAQITWMDPKTKARAATKLQAIAFQIGYPSKWRTYDFDVDAKNFGLDDLAATRWEVARHLGKIGKPIDKDDWTMSPSDVDAYADAQKALMVFPAGILQPPFFSKTFSPAVNLGAIGVVIGHELTHHFDDEGSQFTETGNMENWWLPEDQAKFEAKGSCVADQYSAYEPVPGVKLDGRLTLGENIADIGGLKMAFAAYRNRPRRRDRDPGGRRVLRGPAVLPGVRPGVVRQHPARDGAHARPGRSALQRTVPGRRPGGRHARVRDRVPLRRGHADAPGEHLPGLVRGRDLRPG